LSGFIFFAAMAREVSGSQTRRRAVQEPGEKISVILLLDTNILIDMALERSSHAEPAGELLGNGAFSQTALRATTSLAAGEEFVGA
jgi:hypothetical protein